MENQIRGWISWEAFYEPDFVIRGRLVLCFILPVAYEPGFLVLQPL